MGPHLEAGPQLGPDPTPCIRACDLDPSTRRCTGCHRTETEICAWPGGGSVFGGGGFQ